jgi:superfamily II DNA helicase RecQ
VLQLETDVLAIMNTGSGKTMLALIPALLEPGHASVIVLPLKSLMTDYKRRLDDHNISYEHFQGVKTKQLSGSNNLILVSADIARQSHWKHALATFDHQYMPVVRLIFDEGHFSLTSSDFRASLQNLFDLRSLPMQLVILSGTIPPFSEPAIRTAFGLVSATIILRSSTHRPELQFIIRPRLKNLSDMVLDVQKIIKSHSGRLQPTDRILIFVPFITDGQKLAEVLDCEMYKGGLNDDDKNGIYFRWFKGIHRIMICTNAFGVGNDYHSVRIVIHAGTPLEMIGYIQEISRAGRDKRPAKCYLIPCNKKAPQLTSNEIDHKGQQAIWNMVFASSSCLRSAITQFNDGGDGITCRNDLSNQLCSRCATQMDLENAMSWVENQFVAIPGPSKITTTLAIKEGHLANEIEVAKKSNVKPLTAMFDSMHKAILQDPNINPNKRKTISPTAAFESQYLASKQRKIELGQGSNAYIKTFERALSLFQGLCAICQLHNRELSDHHPIMQCPTLQAYGITAVDDFMAWRKQIQYNSRWHEKICYLCHVPQCHDLLHRTFGGVGSCEYPDVIAGFVYATFLNTTIRKETELYWKVEWNSTSDFIKWLNGKPVAGHKSNLTAIFLRLVEKIYR